MKLRRRDSERLLDMVKMLPVIKIGRKMYFVDERLGELRNVKNPFDRESIELAYTKQGKMRKVV